MGIETLPRRTHLEAMAGVLPLAGAMALDIGCGEGRVTRLMAGSGARVVGIDPGPQQIERALAEPRVAGESYVIGSAEALEVMSGTMDVVVFFNSLHHVPVAGMDRALAEAARVLRPGGWLYIAEPIAEGPQFEMQRPYNDETEVRSLAYATIGRAAAHGLAPESETRYVFDSKHASFEAYRDNSVSVNPARARPFAEKEAELRARFAALGTRRDDGWHFPQPIRVNLLRKR